MPRTTIHRIQVDGMTVFYREGGPPDAPVVLLLHGFPTSSFQYRELMPRLADRYRVIAPDLPGFGFTEVPDQRRYTLLLRCFGEDDPILHRRFAPGTLRDVCFRLRSADRLSSRDGAARSRGSHRVAKRQRL